MHRLRRLPPGLLLMVLVGLLSVGMAGPVRAQLIPSFGGDRAGTSGFQFLKIPVDPRSAALGQTVVAHAFDASALFWNPALAAQAARPQIGLSRTAYFADVTMDYVAALFRPGIGTLTLGASLQALNSGEMEVTTEFQPFGTGERFRYLDLAAGLSVAQQLTDLFSYGVTAKYVRESVAGLTTQTVLFDLGIFYRIGDTGIQTAVAIRNFGLDGIPVGSLERTVIGGDGTVTEDDFARITPPTMFLLGLTYNVLHGNPRNDLYVSGQLINPNDHAESLNVGAEYVWNDVLILRSGYRMGVDEYRTPSFGAGLMLPELLGARARFDYGFNRLDRLGTVHRVGLNLGL